MFGQYENFQFKSSSYSKAEYEWEIKLQFFLFYFILFFLIRETLSILMAVCNIPW